MKNVCKVRLILFVAICFVQFTAKAQTLYGLKKTTNGSTTIPFDVVSINPLNAQTTVQVSTNSLIGVAAGATAYDQQNRRYICWGFDTINNQQLYVVNLDSLTAQSVAFSATQAIEMEYDLQTQKTYGLWWDGSTEHFGEVNLTTGIATSIATLPGVQAVAIGNSTFDSNTNAYIFIGVETGGARRLYKVNATNGSIISSPIIYQNGNRFSALEFNVNNNKLYGLYQDVDSSNYNTAYLSYYTDLRLAEIDIATGVATVIDTSSAVVSGYFAGYAVGGLCFDQATERYIVYVQNENGPALQMVDVLTANTIASTPLDSTDYFYELQVDNYDFAKSFYNLTASTSDNQNALESLTIYPNPSNKEIYLSTNETITSVSIYDVTGKQVMQLKEGILNNINVEELNPGVYTIIVNTSTQTISKKIVRK